MFSDQNIFSPFLRRNKAAKKAKKEESIQSMSEANSKLWETRLTLAEQSKQEYRYRGKNDSFTHDDRVSTLTKPTHLKCYRETRVFNKRPLHMIWKATGLNSRRIFVPQN